MNNDENYIISSLYYNEERFACLYEFLILDNFNCSYYFYRIASKISFCNQKIPKKPLNSFN
jgi:hypothetical protein